MLHLVKYRNQRNLESPLGFKKDWWWWAPSKNLKINEKKTISFLLKKEKELIKKYPIKYKKYITPSLFNVFSFSDKSKELNEIKKCIRLNIKNFLRHIDINNSYVYILCWFNILRKNENMKAHSHEDYKKAEMSFVSGNLFLSGENSSTVYQTPFTNQNIEIPNSPGSLILFPSYITHWTINRSDKIRASIAFNVYPEEDFCNSSFHKDKIIFKLKL